MEKYDKAETSMTVRGILRSEITWLFLLIGSLWMIVETIILPIQALQLGQSQIQAELTSSNADHAAIDARLTKIETDHATFEAVIQQLQQEYSHIVNTRG